MTWGRFTFQKNDYANLVFSGFLNEYSTLWNYLKEEIVTKIKMSDIGWKKWEHHPQLLQSTKIQKQ